MPKSILKFILYGGAVLCAGSWLSVILNAIAQLSAPGFDANPFTILLAAIYVCLAFTPAVMFLIGLKTKTAHWVSIAIVEAIVLALVLYAQLAIATL